VKFDVPSSSFVPCGEIRCGLFAVFVFGGFNAGGVLKKVILYRVSDVYARETLFHHLG
jgi:hypothetical protein